MNMRGGVGGACDGAGAGRGNLACWGVQLLKYRHPDAVADPEIANLTKLGFNHVCFSVDDLDAEVAMLKANGVQLRNEVMTFHDRKLVFLTGPEGITVELAEWERRSG